VKHVHLDELVLRIEQGFGEDLPLPASETDRDAVVRLLQHPGFAPFLQDQINRQIIKDYLVNAVMLDCITEDNFAALSRQSGSDEGRCTLSLQMLMKSVEAANEIPSEIHKVERKALQAMPGSPPHMVIVGS